MKIYVRRRHIERGVAQSDYSCPIALAFEAIAGERPTVDGDYLRTYWHRFQLPRVARRFIARFDSGLPVKPFAFVLK